jgi:hypothetical protein
VQLSQLHAFLTLAHELNFRRAAARSASLGITPSSALPTCQAFNPITIASDSAFRRGTGSRKRAPPAQRRQESPSGPELANRGGPGGSGRFRHTAGITAGSSGVPAASIWRRQHYTGRMGLSEGG